VDEGEWEICSFSKPGPRRSKRIPIPRRFSCGSEHGEEPSKQAETKESARPAEAKESAKPTETKESAKSVETKESAETKPEVDESKPLTLNRLKRKRNRSEDIDVEKPNPKPKKTKKEDNEKKREEEPVKSSPRLRQKTLKATPETPEKSNAPEPESKTKGSAKVKSPDQVEATSPRSSRPETTSRPQRKIAAKTSPEKRKSAAVEEEAKSPKFDVVSDELLNDKVKEGQLQFVRWLMETAFLRSKPIVCCEAETTLKVNDESIDGVAWTCDACRRYQSVRTGSIFAKSGEESLCWIMRLILCWSDNVR
jgi:hypothetical protein